jgi:polysaccharide biosynthesis protein VpsM
MSYQMSPISKSTGTGKLGQSSGASLALFAGIFIACAFAVRGQDYIPEEQLPSSPDNAVAQTDAAPEQPTTPLGGLDSRNLTLGGETVSPKELPAAEPRRFHYSFGLTIRAVYDDNIFLTNSNKVDDWYFAIEPRLTVGWGDIEGRNENYIRLDYIPSIIFYADHSDENAVSHLIQLEGGYRFSRLTLSLSQEVYILDGTNLNSIVDTTGLFANLDNSTFTRLNLFITRLRANYELSAKLFLTGEVDGWVYDYPDSGFISSEMISGGLYINYVVTPKLTLGVGGTFGYNWVDDPSVDQTFEQANFRMNYQVTGKLGLSASAGVEFRQFDDHRDDYVSPVFELGAIYHPFDGTNITLAAGRRILNSGVFANQDFATTYVVGRFHQRLFRRVYLGLAGGYENSDYIATTSGVNAPRNDDYFFISPSIDVLITRWVSVGAYYLHREDNSNIDFFNFDNNQVGVRANFRF